MVRMLLFLPLGMEGTGESACTADADTDEERDALEARKEGGKDTHEEEKDTQRGKENRTDR